MQSFQVFANNDDNNKTILPNGTVSLGSQKTELKYDDSCGYYLEQNIDQGIKISVLGFDDYKLAFNPNNHEYYLFSDVISSSYLSISGLIEIPVSDYRDGSYDNPTTVVHKQVGNLTIYGLWWGGLLNGVGNPDSVASVVIATSFNSQGQASVYAGSPVSTWYYSGWENKDVRAAVIAGTGIFGNMAKWNLRAL